MTTTATGPEARLLELYGRFTPSPALRPLNEAAAKRFAAIGFPGKKHEMFTFVGLREIIATPFEYCHGAAQLPGKTEIGKHVYPGCEKSVVVLVDGKYEETLSDLSALGGAVTASPLEHMPDTARMIEETNRETDVFACINALFLSGGVSIEVKSGASPRATVQVLHFTTGTAGNNAAHAPRVSFSIGHGATVSVAEKFAGTGAGRMLNAVTVVAVGEGANVNWARLQADARDGFHFSATRIRLAKDARFKEVGGACGGRLARHNCEARLMGEGAELSLLSLAVLEGAEQSHSYFRAHHEAPHCASFQLFKNILGGAAKASVDTAAVVHAGAQFTVSRQLINNLMLSAEARADTKPTLNIAADDVKCNHGATVGRVDENQIFYMVSRGLAEKQARALLTAGFAKSVISEMAFAPAADETGKLLLRKLETQ